jgi:hypothetical protein
MNEPTEEAPTCCLHPMDENMGGWTCMKCGRHVRPYPDDPEPEPDPYTVNPDPYGINPDLSLELDELRARVAELECQLSHARDGLAARCARIAALEAERDEALEKARVMKEIASNALVEEEKP